MPRNTYLNEKIMMAIVIERHSIVWGWKGKDSRVMLIKSFINERV